MIKLTLPANLWRQAVLRGHDGAMWQPKLARDDDYDQWPFYIGLSFTESCCYIWQQSKMAYFWFGL